MIPGPHWMETARDDLALVPIGALLGLAFTGVCFIAQHYRELATACASLFGG